MNRADVLKLRKRLPAEYVPLDQEEVSDVIDVYEGPNGLITRCRSTMLSVKEELVFGGDWETAKQQIDAILAKLE